MKRTDWILNSRSWEQPSVDRATRQRQCNQGSSAVRAVNCTNPKQRTLHSSVFNVLIPSFCTLSFQVRILGYISFQTTRLQNTVALEESFIFDIENKITIEWTRLQQHRSRAYANLSLLPSKTQKTKLWNPLPSTQKKRPSSRGTSNLNSCSLKLCLEARKNELFRMNYKMTLWM